MPSKPAIVSMADMSIEQHDALFVITELVRTGKAVTRSDLGRLSGLGRSIVSQRVDDAISLGLIEEGDYGVSTGGRMPRNLRFRHEIGCYIVVVFNTPWLTLSVTDLAGRVLQTNRVEWDYAIGPDQSMPMVPKLFATMNETGNFPPVWASVVGVPGPVEYDTGKLQASMLAGWNGFDIRGYMQNAFSAPCWVDNEVNLMAQGELAILANSAEEQGNLDNLLYVVVGIGVGAGIISDGKMHRGANGSAGAIGHIAAPEGGSVLCRCGQIGCLTAVAGGWGLARDGELAAKEGRSPYLADVMAKNGFLAYTDIANGVKTGDSYCREAVARSGRIVGEALAGMVNFFNPGLLVMGGAIAETGDVFLAAVRQSIYRRALPLATRDLCIVASDPNYDESLIGGAALAQTEIFTRSHMNQWIEARVREEANS